MNETLVVILGMLVFCAPSCRAQQLVSDMPDAPTPQVTAPASPLYSPPTQGERFKTYFRHTYGIASVLEAGARGGIEQARDNPSEWPQGAQGYADRFGSAMGEIAIRGTTEYVVGAAFKEDLRVRRCHGCSLEAKFKAAFEDSFTARKGGDGHRAFSVARIVGPISGSAVAANTWYPAGSGGRSETFRGAGLTYGLVFVRNFARELLAH